MSLTFNYWNTIGFFFGLTFLLSIDYIGQLYLSQLLITIVFILYIFNKKIYLDNVEKKIIILGFLWLIFSLISNLINANTPNNSLRDLFKIIVTLFSFFLFINYFKKKSKTLLGFFYYIYLAFFFNHIINIFNKDNFIDGLMYEWKFGLANTLTILILFQINIFKKYKYFNFINIFFLLLLIIISFILGVRSFFLIFFFTFVFLIFKNLIIKKKNYNKIINIIFFVIFVILFYILFYYLLNNFNNEFTSKTLKFSSGNTDFSSIILGARGELIVAFYNILENPFFGSGGWSQNCDLWSNQLTNFLLNNNLYDKFDQYDKLDYLGCFVGGHSIILRAWSENGFFGFLFFLHLFYLVMYYLIKNIKDKSSEYFVLTYLSFYFIYHLFFSPYGGTRMVLIPLIISLIINIGEKLKKNENFDSNNII